MTATLPLRLDGRSLALLSSIGLHLALFAVTGGRGLAPTVHRTERLSFAVVARPPAPDPAPPAPAAAGRSNVARTATPSHADASKPLLAAVPVVVAESPVSMPSPAPAAHVADGDAPMVAAPQAGPSAGSESASAAAAAGQGFDLAGYGRGLHALVTAKKSYPVLARKMGLEGATQVRVRLRDDGTLDGAPVVTKSSGHELLDREALRMVEAAAPFPAFTESGRRALSLAMTIRFALDEV